MSEAMKVLYDQASGRIRSAGYQDFQPEPGQAVAEVKSLPREARLVREWQFDPVTGAVSYLGPVPVELPDKPWAQDASARWDALSEAERQDILLKVFQRVFSAELKP